MGDNSVSEIMDNLDNSLSLLRQLLGSGSISWRDEEFVSRFKNFTDIVFDKDKSNLDRHGAVDDFEDYLIQRFAFEGREMSNDVSGKLRAVHSEIRSPKKAHKRVLSRHIRKLREALHKVERVSLEDVKNPLEDARSGLLTLAQEEKSSTLNVSLEDLESCVNSLAGKPDLERAIEDLESCKSQLKRYIHELPPSGIVPLTGDAMTLFRALRNAGSSGFTKKKGMDLLDCSESKFFDLLKEIREAGVKVDVEGEGSAERKYVYKGR